MNDRFFYFGAEVTAVAPGNLDNEAVKSMWTGFTCTCGNICFVHSEDNRFCIEIGNPEKAELKENSEYTVNISENGIYYRSPHDTFLCIPGNNAFFIKKTYPPCRSIPVYTRCD